MLITISGTPGTGKTAAAKILAKMIHARLISTNYLLRKYGIKVSYDKTRKTKIIDTKKLSKAAKKEKGDVIFEGHLSHFARADVSIVLRTSPRELEKRLKRKGWNKRKINENVEAEALGIISHEAGGMEIDTTGKSAKRTAETIARIIKSKRHKRKRIDWTKAYKKYLVRSKR